MILEIRKNTVEYVCCKTTANKNSLVPSSNHRCNNSRRKADRSCAEDNASAAKKSIKKSMLYELTRNATDSIIEGGTMQLFVKFESDCMSQFNLVQNCLFCSTCLFKRFHFSWLQFVNIDCFLFYFSQKSQRFICFHL